MIEKKQINFWEPAPAIAINVRPGPNGELLQREGVSQAVALPISSGWSNGNRMLVQSGDSLYEVYIDSYGYDSILIKAGLTQLFPGEQLSAAVVGNRIFWTNTYEQGVIENGKDRQWGYACDILPSWSISNGALLSGRYLFVLTFVREDGFESSCTEMLEVYNPSDTGSIAFNNIPTDASAKSVRLYGTHANGSVLRLIAEFAPGTASFEYEQDVGGMEYLPNDTGPQEVFTFIAQAWGFLVGTVGEVLFWSGSSPERFSWSDRFLCLDSTITGIGFTGDTLIIGTQTQVYKMQGGLVSQNSFLSLVSSVGMVHGSLVVQDGRVVWTDRLGNVWAAVAGASPTKVGLFGFNGSIYTHAYAGIHPLSGAYFLQPIIPHVLGNFGVNLPLFSLIMNTTQVDCTLQLPEILLNFSEY